MTNWGHWALDGSDHVAPLGIEYPKVVACADVGIGYTLRDMAYLTLFVVISTKYTYVLPLFVVIYRLFKMHCCWMNAFISDAL